MSQDTLDVVAVAPADSTLLDEYVRSRSAGAFALLVRRYGGLVYGVALRHLRDPDAAEDVAQQVFALVATRPTAVRRSAVAGWLHTAARRCAADRRRADFRRRAREQRAARPESVLPGDESDAELLRLLDDALANLRDGDRDLVLSYYLAEQPCPVLARQRGISEASARKRLSRAVERLRQYVAGRGVDASLATVTGGLLGMRMPAPAGLASRAMTTAPPVSSPMPRRVAGVAAVCGVGAILILLLTSRPPPPPPAPVAAVTTPQPVPTKLAEFPIAELLKPEAKRTFVTAMTSDAQGNLWVGTEGAGVWRFDPVNRAWTSFTPAEGLGDTAVYAVACDHLGRVWAGLGRHGVSVFDGRAWRNYDVVAGDPAGADDRRPDALAGPVGERAFAIAVCPTDGDVWMATSAGLTRYAEATGTWTHYSRADGLPSDLANAIAFDPAGNIYVGTQTDGVAMADAADHYAHWRNTTAPARPPAGTATDVGAGLPSGYVNDVMVAHDGRIYAGTQSGLAWSDDRGATWRYVRGADWIDKAQMDALPSAPLWPGQVPVHLPPNMVVPPKPPQGDAVLAEDYVSALGETPGGDLLVGYRRRGWQRLARDAANGFTVANASSTGCFRTLPRAGNSYPCIGSYLSGDMDALDDKETDAHIETRPAPVTLPPMPIAARPLTLAELNAALAMAAAVPPDLATSGPVIPLPDDWRTQGQWIGRYGRHWCVLDAIDSPNDYVWGAAAEPVAWSVGLGHSARVTEFNRYDARKAGTDLAAPELPPILYDAWTRNKADPLAPEKTTKFATRNDGSLHYPETYDGPNLVWRIDVPAGTFVLSAYEVNGDERDSRANYRRDFGLLVRSAAGTPATAAETPTGRGGTHLDQGPILAQSRARDFETGVYKRFLVRGPAPIVLEVARNYSYVTTGTAIMLDRVDPYPAPYFATADDWNKARVARADQMQQQAKTWTAAAATAALHPATTEAEAASRLAAELDRLRDWNPAWWALHHRTLSVQLARWYTAHPDAVDPAGRSVAWYGSDLFETWEAADVTAGRRPAREVERSLRWDGHTADNSGTGYQEITRALATGGPGL